MRCLTMYHHALLLLFMTYLEPTAVPVTQMGAGSPVGNGCTAGWSACAMISRLSTRRGPGRLKYCEPSVTYTRPARTAGRSCQPGIDWTSERGPARRQGREPGDPARRLALAANLPGATASASAPSSGSGSPLMLLARSSAPSPAQRSPREP